MDFKFIGNDTIALAFLGVVAILGIVLQSTEATNVALGAIGGYIGSKALN